MTTTHATANPEVAPPVFEMDQEVSIGDLRAVIAPQNTLDPVEEARLRMVGDHVSELLRSDLPPGEAAMHENFIYSLGGEAVLELLPRHTEG